MHFLLEVTVTVMSSRKKEKEKFTLFSDHNGLNGSLLRRQPGAMTIDHSVMSSKLEGPLKAAGKCRYPHISVMIRIITVY